MDEPDGISISGYWAAPAGLAFVVIVASLIMLKPTHHHGSELRYVGPSTCEECHEDQYASWSKTRMAQSFDVLLPGANVAEKELAGLDPEADFSHDSGCLPCHTTGYGLVGGFVSIEETPEMAGVSCEACHGSGGRYAGSLMSKEKPGFRTQDAERVGLVYPPTESVCTTCHNDDSPFVGMDYVFDFDERVKQGTHEHHRLEYDHEGLDRRNR